MAINKKVPSKEEIKSSPQPFPKQELEEITKLRNNLSELTFQLGQLYIQKIKVEEQEKFLKTKLTELETEEANLAKSLSDKYGKGTLDIETGTFTPSE